MKTTSIFITIIGIAITIYCIFYFRTSFNVVDSDPITVNPANGKTSEWPIFIGLLTTLVGVTFLFIATQKKASKGK